MTGRVHAQVEQQAAASGEQGHPSPESEAQVTFVRSFHDGWRRSDFVAGGGVPDTAAGGYHRTPFT
eukprot:COSAG01_NODE_7246_length_3284_cov_8.194035_4_plen_66_part_00